MSKDSPAAPLWILLEFTGNRQECLRVVLVLKNGNCCKIRIPPLCQLVGHVTTAAAPRWDQCCPVRAPSEAPIKTKLVQSSHVPGTGSNVDNVLLWEAQRTKQQTGWRTRVSTHFSRIARETRGPSERPIPCFHGEDSPRLPPGAWGP